MVLFYVLLTVLLWGVAPIFDKLALAKVDPQIGVLIRGLTTSAFMLAIAGASGRLKTVGSLDPRSVAMVVLSAIFASMLGQWAYFKALQMGKASQVVPLCSTYPVVAAVLGGLLLREKLTPERVAGIVLVAAGIWLIKR